MAMDHSDPARLLKNLANQDIWNPMDLEKVTERDWIGLRNPIVLNARGLQVRIIRIFKDRSLNTWKISAHGGDIPEATLAFKFEDNSLYQYILICGKRVKVGTVFELPLVKAYKSTYFRQNRRFAVQDFGWHLSNLILPAEEVNVHQRKSAITVIFETYAKLSPEDMKNAHFAFFQEDDPPLLRYVRATGNGFAVGDAVHGEAEETRKVEFFSRYYTFASLKDALPDLQAREEQLQRYKATGIRCEVIFPISVPRKDGSFNYIGYIHSQFRGGSGGIRQQLLQSLISTAEAVSVSIRNSNFERYPVKEPAIDASLTGLKVQIRDPRVRKALSQVSSFRATLYTGSEASPLDVRLEKMQQVTVEDMDYIGCRIADIMRKSYVDAKTDSRETAVKAYRAALNGLKTTQES
jgi:hypothetical protein